MVSCNNHKVYKYFCSMVGYDYDRRNTGKRRNTNQTKTKTRHIWQTGEKNPERNHNRSLRRVPTRILRTTKRIEAY